MSAGGAGRSDSASSLATQSDAVQVTRTISESDVYAYAGITGDLAPMHMNAEYAASTFVGERIAHGALIVGLMSAASTAWCAKNKEDTLAYGMDRVRFIKPVRLGDTVTVTYATHAGTVEGPKMFAAVEAHNQHGELVAVATHILWKMP